MSALTALLLYGAWMLLLALSYVMYRVPLVLLGRRPADFWTRGRTVDDPSVLIRAQHAHLNCVENFPVFAAVVLAATTLGRGAVADSVAGWVLYARVGQSLAHLLGTTLPLVVIRATLYLTQVALILWMIWSLLR